MVVGSGALLGFFFILASRASNAFRTGERFFASEIHYQGIDASIDIELVPLAKTRTRMIVGLELKPRSIKAKLVVQSLKIAKGSIQRRIENRLKSFARELEQQARD